jgi:hypothetical protein
MRLDEQPVFRSYAALQRRTSAVSPTFGQQVNVVAITSQLSLLLQGSAGKTKLWGLSNPRSISHRELRPNEFLDSSLEASLDTNRAALGIDDHCGQMWSVLTTNRHGMARLEELRPAREDGNYVAGFTIQWIGAPRSRRQ